jgi:integrase
MAQKPEKPPGCPLFPHNAGVWAKKVRGKLHYFGPWSDLQGAWDRWLAQKDYLLAGRKPPTGGLTVDELLHLFYTDKVNQNREGSVTDACLDEYKITCDVVLTHFGPTVEIETLRHEDYAGLRKALTTGKRGQTYAPSTIKRRLTIARMIFSLGADQLGTPLPFKKPLQSPSKLVMRRRQRKLGPRMYAAADLRKLVKAADPHLRAMILLGINCGFGPMDCRTLSASAIGKEWLTHPRSKTEVDRRCPLWPETAKALKALPKGDHVFNGRVWNRHVIARQFEALCRKCKVKNHGFYSLRRTFETVATTADVNQAVIDAIMGHTRNDMASVYRQKIFDQQLRRCSDHVRLWYLGKVTLV